MSLPVLPLVIEAGGPRDYSSNYIFWWNNVALDLVRLTHTLSGPQNGPPLTARFLGILHLAMHDAYFELYPYANHPSRNTNFDNDFEAYLSVATLSEIRPTNLTSIQKGATARNEAKNAVAGAAITVMNKLFKSPAKKEPNVSDDTTLALGGFIDGAFRFYEEVSGLDLRSPGYEYGVKIANAVLGQLEIPASQPGVDPGPYMPNTNHPYYFDDDPSHPIRPRPIDPNDPEEGNKPTRPYHGPFYGDTSFVFATTDDIKIADPPVVPSRPPDTAASSTDYRKYLEAVEDVFRMGGIEELATTKRRPAQTAGGLFWAYDGTNLIGTPPRFYNQIIRQIAIDKLDVSKINSDQNNAELIRLFALTNTAMADAGIFCWRDKYKYEMWRPLSGVRSDPTGPVPDGYSRPTWRVLGAPATNSNEGGFKPPFPAYPSGHATFASAGFQMVRLFYDQRGDKIFKEVKDKTKTSQDDQKPLVPPHSDFANDTIEFTVVSDELNGISRELYQPYNPSAAITNQSGDVRTRVPMTFKSLKEAIFSNAISRIWLGVHWHFDAFEGKDVFEPYDKNTQVGKDHNQPHPNGYEQLYQVEADGSTKYKPVAEMDWFANQGPRDGTGCHPTGGVPLGIMIADNIFGSKMRSTGSLVDLGSHPQVHRT